MAEGVCFKEEHREYEKQEREREETSQVGIEAYAVTSISLISP